MLPYYFLLSDFGKLLGRLTSNKKIAKGETAARTGLLGVARPGVAPPSPG
jgi:hypothetical protein